MSQQFLVIVIISTLYFLFPFSNVFADETKGSNYVQSVNETHDLQKNTVSNVEFYTSNYGIFSYDYNRGLGGCFWPRGSGNQYIFAGGFWFGAKKFWDGELRKCVSVSYNPNNGRSWYVPGRIEDEFPLNLETPEDYFLNLSTNYDKQTGECLSSGNLPDWPVWDNDPGYNLNSDNYYGRYVYDKTARNRSKYTKGPAFISDEDIFCVFKDNYLDEYDGGAARRYKEGYPLYLQVEHTIYSWGSEQYKDIIFLRYDLINMSEDTLLECWFAPLLDADIALASNARVGASNDRCRYFVEMDSLNLAVNWTNSDQLEGGKGFGYAGYEFLQSPAVKKCENLVNASLNGVEGEYCSQCTKWEIQNGTEVCIDSIIFDKTEEHYLRTDKKSYLSREQLGLVTFRNWPIELDPKEDYDRFDFISASTKDGDNGPGDKRILFSTGPFNMLPGDTASVWIGIVFALPSVRQNADGSAADIGLGPKIRIGSLLDKVMRSRELLAAGLVTGVSDYNTINNFGILSCTAFPNPASESIIIELNSPVDKVTSLCIYNLQGEKIFSINNPELQQNRLHIDLSGIESGTYIIKTTVGNNYAFGKFNVVR